MDEPNPSGGMDQATRFPPFEVTRAAIEQIKVLGGVLVGLAEGGCCGTTYVYAALAPEEIDGGSEDDAGGKENRGVRPVHHPGGSADNVEAEWFGCPGAWLLVEPAALTVLTGARLDYRASSKPPRFRVEANPNTPQRCPCRRSFGAEWPGPRQPTCRAYAPMPWDESYEPPADWARRTGWARRT